MSFWVWLLFLSIFYIHVVACVNTSFFLRLSNIPLCGFTTFTWTLGCFHFSATMNNAVMMVSIQVFVQMCIFISPSYIPVHQRGIAGSKDNHYVILPDISPLFSIEIVPCCILSEEKWKCLFIYSLANRVCILILNQRNKWKGLFGVVLTCIFSYSDQDWILIHMGEAIWISYFCELTANFYSPFYRLIVHLFF